MIRRWRALRIRLAGLFRRPALERELDEELRYHLEQDIARRIAAGTSPAEARRAALRDFGHSGTWREAVRDTWGLRWLDELRQDVSYGLRTFRRAPGFSSTVVLTIALGLGLNATAFTVFNGYMLRPLHVRDPGALFEPMLVDRAGHTRRFSWSEFQSLQSRTDVFARTFGYRYFLGRMSGQPVFAQLVTGDYFPMLGVEPALGRMLGPQDAIAPGGGPVVVMSYRLWHSRFGADSGVIGRRMAINGVPLEVIGVAPPTFEGHGVPIDCWIPFTMVGRFEDQPGIFGPAAPPAMWAIGRLRRGIDAGEARGALAVWARAVTSQRPDSDRAAGVLLEPRGTLVPLNREILTAVIPVAVGFGLILLIACANVANMMLARGMARQREIGIRLSLGAGRGRLIRQLLTESVLLSIPAALAGFLFSRFTLDVGWRITQASLPSDFASLVHLVPLPPDMRVLGFMFGSAIAAAVLFGLAPALQSTRAEIVQATRGDFDTPTRSSRLRNSLVVGQIAVCVLLFVLASVLLRGARQMEHLDAGVRFHDAIELMVPQRLRVPVLERLSRDPQVAVVAAGQSMPFDGIFPQTMFRSDSTTTIRGGFNLVTPSYLTVLDIPVLQGRNFTDAEARAGAAVAVVSEGAARALWPGRLAIGQTLQVALDPAQLRGGVLSNYRTATVVGVARNAVSGWLGVRLDWPVIYYPTAADAAGTTLLLRVAGEPARTLRAVDQELAAIDSAAVQQIHPLEQAWAVQVYPFRAAYWVSSLLGAVALLVTVTGVYGVLAYVVERRTREMGIRMALGASGQQVVLLVLRNLTALAGIGIVIGGGLALLTSKFLNAYLWMIDTFDPIAYGGGILAVLVACLAAGFVPSRRAARVEPVTALRHD